MGSGDTMGRVLGPLQIAAGVGLSAMGSPEIGLPLLAGGVGSTAGGAIGGGRGAGIGEMAGLGLGTAGEGFAGMGPLGGMLPNALPSSVAGPMAQNTMLPGPAAVQQALNTNPALKGLTLGSFNPADVLGAARGPMAGAAPAMGAGGDTLSQINRSLPLVNTGMSAMNAMNQPPQPPQQPRRIAAPPMAGNLQGMMPQASSAMAPPLQPPQQMAMPAPGPFPGAPPQPPGQPQLTPQQIAMLMQRFGGGGAMMG